MPIIHKNRICNHVHATEEFDNRFLISDYWLAIIQLSVTALLQKKVSEG